MFRASLPGVKLTQGEYDLYMDFTYQFGITNWRTSSMRRNLLNGEYLQACNALPAGGEASGRGIVRCRRTGARKAARACGPGS
ncbi:glycoside hydrolase family protein [Comamonas sp. JC664]|uniref:glycoside hydrolase family protein n=1 Tax=Comamonas sp. JC664 TaxID=2801917 RepID=UPI003610C193